MNKNKITKLAVVLVLICFLLSTFISLWTISYMAQNSHRDLSRMMTARIYDTMIGELYEPIMVGEAMANNRFLIDKLLEEDSMTEEEAVREMKQYLWGVKNGLGYETAFVVSEASRRYYSFNGLNKVIDPVTDEYDLWYTDFVDSGKQYKIDINNDEVTEGAWTVFIDTRIEDSEGRLLGVCGVGQHMTKSSELFNSLENKYKVKINLVDPTGLVQVDTDETKILNDRIDLSTLNMSDGDEYSFSKLGNRKYAVTKYVDKMGWYLVVRSDGSDDTAQILNVILLNVVLCLFVMAIMLIAIRIIILRTIALADASYKDQSTLLLNRRAFEEEKARLMNESLDEDLVYITVDVNGLKAVNDTLGHTAGDELIKGAADCLRKCFEKYGKVFRIGGDEFAALIMVSEEKFEQLKKELDKYVSEWKGELVDKLSVSCGYATHREFPSESISELAHISDERMYEDKAEHYRKLGIDRRRR